MLLTVHVKVSDFPSSIYWYNPSLALSQSLSRPLSRERERRKRVGTENNTRACECVSNWAFILRCLLYNIIFQFASVFLCVKIVREKQFVTKEVVYLKLRVSQYISYPKLVNVQWSPDMAIQHYLIIINLNKLASLTFVDSLQY